MPRGSRFSQAFMGGGQLYFGGRKIVSGSASKNTSATEIEKTKNFVKTNVETQTFFTNSPRFLTRIKCGAKALVTVTTSARTVLSSRVGDDTALESTVGVAWYIRIADAFRVTFTEAYKSELFNEMSSASETEANTTELFTEVSSMTFQDDGVSSYEDGESYPPH